MARTPQLLLIDDIPLARRMIRDVLRQARYEVLADFGDNESAQTFIEHEIINGQRIDTIVTDVIRPGGSGIEFVRWLRRRPSDQTMDGGLRVCSTPILVLTSGGVLAAKEAFADDPSVVVLGKDDFDSLPASIDRLLRDHRARLLRDLHRVGLAITWEEDQYTVLNAYARPHDDRIVTATVLGSADDIGRSLADVVLVDDDWEPAQRAIDAFEALLNDPKTTERDLQEFFTLYPEFLLRGDFDALWPEPRLAIAGTRSVRPDFVLQPRGVRDIPWHWGLVDLKSPKAPLLVNRRFHPSFSHHVTRVVQQLRDYERYFADPANERALRARFGGVVPQPKLTAVIGRLPAADLAMYQRLRHQLGAITITTYDELLELRRADVNRLRAQHTRAALRPLRTRS